MITKQVSELQKKRAMQGRFVKARLIERGIKVKDVARIAGCVSQSVTIVLSGRRSGAKRIRPAIARLLGLRQDDLWPNSHAA